MEYLDETLEDVLRGANQKIQEILELAEHQGSGRVKVTVQHLSELLSELARTSAALAPPRECEQGSGSNAEVEEYRRNLTRLRAALPGLQSRLLVERARLERERTHLKSVERWAQANHSTLESL